MTRSRITGTGSYLPEKLVTNRDLEALVETSDDWIVARTGIRERHIAAEGEFSSDLALHACRRALEAAGRTAADVDLIVLATSTPDMVFPSFRLPAAGQARREARRAAFDVQAVCSGSSTRSPPRILFIRSGPAQVRAGDRRRGVLAHPRLEGPRHVRALRRRRGARWCSKPRMSPGILSSHLHADGSYASILNTPGHVCGGAVQGDPTLKMDGGAVFKLAVRVLEESAREALGLPTTTRSPTSTSTFPHQANVRIVSHVAKKLGLPESKCIVTVDRHANTSAASIPLALDVAVRDGRFARGHNVLLQGVGGGFTWGSVLLNRY
jgi:3-oxoacyl-[acyl-carrier-protein] synthase-3